MSPPGGMNVPQHAVLCMINAPTHRHAMSTAESLPLAGTTLVVTRPTASAAAQVRMARGLGARVVRLPGIALHAIEDPAQAARALQEARTATAWIFTSPAAVRFAFDVLPAWRPAPDSRVFAVGAGTRNALARHAIAAHIPVAGHDSASLLAMAELAAPAGWSVVLVDAPGGSNMIAPELRARGAEVERIHVYRRMPPRLNRRHFDALGAAPAPWLTLLSSGEALENLVAALPAAILQRWRTQPLIVSSARLAARASAHGFGEVRIAPSALSGDLLAAACIALERHRL